MAISIDIKVSERRLFDCVNEEEPDFLGHNKYHMKFGKQYMLYIYM